MQQTSAKVSYTQTISSQETAKFYQLVGLGVRTTLFLILKQLLSLSAIHIVNVFVVHWGEAIAIGVALNLIVMFVQTINGNICIVVFVVIFAGVVVVCCCCCVGSVRFWV